MPTTLKVRIGERWYAVEVDDLDANPVKVRVDGEPMEVDIDRLPPSNVGQSLAAPAAEDVVFAESTISDDELPAQAAESAVADHAEALARLPQPVREFRSPMAGVIVSVSVKKGDQVVTGDEICILEAMKMQQVLRADWSGIVDAVHVDQGHQIREGDLIAELT